MSEFLRLTPLIPVYHKAPELAYYQPIAERLRIDGSFQGEGVTFVTAPRQEWNFPELVADPDIIQFSTVPVSKISFYKGEGIVGVLDIQDEHIQAEGEYGYATAATVRELLVFCRSPYKQHLPQGEETLSMRIFEEYEERAYRGTGNSIDNGIKAHEHWNNLKRMHARELRKEERAIAKHDEPIREGVLVIDKDGKLQTHCLAPISNSNKLLPQIGSFEKSGEKVVFSLSPDIVDVFTGLLREEQQGLEETRKRVGFTAHASRTDTTENEIRDVLDKVARRAKRRRLRNKRR